MPSPEFTDLPEFARVLAEARAGSPDALGRVLMDCRDYLLLAAGRKLGPDLQRNGQRFGPGAGDVPGSAA
jgi:hypothetical protein